MRVLIIAPNQSRKWNWGHQHLRNEFGSHCEVVYYGAGFKNKGNPNIKEVVEELGPFDCILTWDQTYCGYFDSIKDIDIPKAVFLVDYVPVVGKADKNDEFIRKHEFDFAFLRSTYCMELFQKRKKQGRIPEKTQGIFLPFGVNTNIYYDWGQEREYDVCAIFSIVSWAYPRRSALIEAVNAMAGISVIAGGHSGQGKIVHEAYISAINRSKMFINSNGTYKAVLMKYFEAMACRTLLITDEPTDGHLMGFIDGENIIYYRNIQDAVRKIRYYKDNPDERFRIATNGYRLVHTFHDNSKRVQQVLEVMSGKGEVINGIGNSFQSAYIEA